ncbi:MAG TPA: complex I NDUFA9 subunit family protein [Sphingomonas sp.]|nr:complex I NDUFA9 subunit family protein [Sphingomonas sp.]
MNELVTVFGGGGFLGRYVVQELLRSGARVRIAGREPLDAHFLKPLSALGQAQSVRADITRPETLGPAVQGAGAVINLVGILDGKFDAVHVDGARNAARAAASAGAGRFVQVSAIGAAPQAASAYSRTKGLGEQAVRDAFPAAAIVRPSILFGPEDGFVNRFAAMIALAPVVPVVRPGVRLQPVWVVDAARAIARLALSPVAAAEIFELGGPQILTMIELYRWIGEAIAREPKYFPLPDVVAAAIARLGWLPGTPITWDQWLTLQEDNVVHAGAKGFAEIGIDPAPLAAVAPAWLVRYRRHGRFSLNAA